MGYISAKLASIFPVMKERALKEFENGNVKPVADILKFGGFSTRYDVARVLAKKGLKGVALLIAGLESKKNRVWSTVCSGLEHIGDPNTVELLIKALNSQNRDVRWGIVRALRNALEVRFGIVHGLKNICELEECKPLIAKTLIGILSKDDFLISADTVYALGKLKDFSAVEPIIEVLKKSRHLNVRYEAALALGEIGNSRAIEALRDAASRDTDKDVRTVAQFSLETITEPVKLLDKIVTGEIVTHKMTEVGRKEAVEKIGTLKDPGTIDVLIKALKDDSIGVRRSAIEGMKNFKDPRLVEPVIATLEDNDEFVRVSACEALGEALDLRAVEPLIKLLTDQSEFVKTAAAAALGKLKDAKAIDPLIKALGDKNTVFLLAVINALNGFEDSDAQEAAKKALETLK